MEERCEDRYVRVGDARARYWRAGESGSPVLLLGGIGCSVLEWRSNIGAIAERHTVYALDMLGEGLTDKPEGARYALADLARFTCGFLREVGVDAPISSAIRSAGASRWNARARSPNACARWFSWPPPGWGERRIS